jgi:tRNA nucleotidyltransferase (CCA-adding enzyme)
MTTMTFFEVGGAVRDELMGVECKDVDFVVVMEGVADMTADEAFTAMVDALEADGFKVHTTNPEHFTVRCGVPAGHALRARTKDADFVLARFDGPSSDGRRPDCAKPGTLADDLDRRDFTVNAMAKDPVTGVVVDRHGGRADLEAGVLRTVGDPMVRFREDFLRALRAVRFSVTKGFVMTPECRSAVESVEVAEGLVASVSTPRVMDEVDKMFAHDMVAASRMMMSMPQHFQDAVMRPGVSVNMLVHSTSAVMAMMAAVAEAPAEFAGGVQAKTTTKQVKGRG